MSKRVPVFLPILSLLTLFSARATSASSHSQVRVVSLAFVQGTVIARKPGSTKWVRADLNMPIEQGVSIATARNSIAEVQFENGSTVRIGELSRVDFSEMGSAPRGGYVNRLSLLVGLATLNFVSKRRDEFILTAGTAMIKPHGKAELRVDLSHSRLRVEVFNGRVDAFDSNQSQQLRKNQVLACDYTPGGAFQITNTIQKDEWDQWVQMRNQQASLDAYQSPAPGMYDWESDIVPFGGMGSFSAILAADGF